MVKIVPKIKELLIGIGIMILSATVAFFITSALSGGLSKAVISEVDFEFADHSESLEASDTSGIGPGDCINAPIMITNTGDADSYVFVTIEQPLCMDPVFKEDSEPILESDGFAPLYVWMLNPRWTQVDEEIKDGKLRSTFSYESILSSGNTTTPVFDSLTMQNFTIGCYCKFENINLEKTVFGGATEAFKDCVSSADRWEVIKNFYQ